MKRYLILIPLLAACGGSGGSQGSAPKVDYKAEGRFVGDGTHVNIQSMFGSCSEQKPNYARFKKGDVELQSVQFFRNGSNTVGKTKSEVASASPTEVKFRYSTPEFYVNGVKAVMGSGTSECRKVGTDWDCGKQSERDEKTESCYLKTESSDSVQEVEQGEYVFADGKKARAFRWITEKSGEIICATGPDEKSFGRGVEKAEMVYVEGLLTRMMNTGCHQTALTHIETKKESGELFQNALFEITSPILRPSN